MGSPATASQYLVCTCMYVAKQECQSATAAIFARMRTVIDVMVAQVYLPSSVHTTKLVSSKPLSSPKIPGVFSKQGLNSALFNKSSGQQPCLPSIILTINLSSSILPSLAKLAQSGHALLILPMAWDILLIGHQVA